MTAQPGDLPLTLPRARLAAPAVAISHLYKWFDERIVLKDISVELRAGRIVALLGANGAGKSTLLNLLAMLTPPSRGQLQLFGQTVGARAGKLRARIGMIAHQSMLYRDLSVRENLTFFGKLYGCKKLDSRIRKLLESVALADRADDAVKTLSRGMAQRAAIARALLHDPDLLLADEPFTGLDAPSIDILHRLLAGLREAGKTIVAANHDVAQSLALADEALVLRDAGVAIHEPTAKLTAAAVVREIGRK